MIVLGKKGKRYSPRFQFQVVLEVLKGKRDAMKIARAHDLHPYFSLARPRPQVEIAMFACPGERW